MQGIPEHCMPANSQAMWNTCSHSTTFEIFPLAFPALIRTSLT